MMKTIGGAVVAAMAIPLALAAPASAHRQPHGTMTYQQWDDLLTNHMRLDRVEKMCSCTGARFGYVHWRGAVDQHPRKVMVFTGAESGSEAHVQFRQWDNGTWHANREKQWWVDSVPTDQVIWVKPVGMRS